MVLNYFKKHVDLKSVFKLSHKVYGAKSPNICEQLSPVIYTSKKLEFDEEHCKNGYFEIKAKNSKRNLMSNPNESITPAKRPENRPLRSSTVQQRRPRLARTGSTRRSRHNRIANTSNREHISRHQRAVSRRVRQARESAPTVEIPVAEIPAAENPIVENSENIEGILRNNTQQVENPIDLSQSNSFSINSANLRLNINRSGPNNFSPSLINLATSSGIIKQPVLNIPNLSPTLINNATNGRNRFSQTLRDIRNEERLLNRPRQRLSTESSESSEDRIEQIQIDEIVDRTPTNSDLDFHPNLSESSSEFDTETHTESENISLTSEGESENQSIHSNDSEMAFPPDFAENIQRAMDALTAKLDEIDERTRRFENQFNEGQNANRQDGQNADQRDQNGGQNRNRNRPNRAPNEDQELRRVIQLLTGAQKYELPSLENADTEKIKAFIRATNLHFDNINDEFEDDILMKKIKERVIICTWIPERDIQDAQNWPEIRTFLEARLKREGGPDRLRAKTREHHQTENESMINYVKRTEDLMREYEALYGPRMQDDFRHEIEDKIRDAFERGVYNRKIRNIIQSRASISLDESTSVALRLQSRHEDTSDSRETVCAYCKKEGHRKFECLSHKSDIQKSNEAAKAIVNPYCTSCRMAGHSAATCFVSKKNDNKQQGNSNKPIRNNNSNQGNTNKSNQNNENFGGAKPKYQNNNQGNSSGNNSNNGNKNFNNNQNNGGNRYNNTNQNSGNNQNNGGNRYNNSTQNSGNNQNSGNGYNNGNYNNFNGNRNNGGRQAYYTVNQQPQSSFNPSASNFVPSQQFYPSAPPQESGN